MAHPLHKKSRHEHSSHMGDEHDAYLAYTSRFQSQTTASLLQVALDTETIREAQFLEGLDWRADVSSVPRDPIPQPDTGVLGSLVGLFRKNETDFGAIRNDLAHLQQTSNHILTQMSSAPIDFLETPHDIHTIDDTSSFQHESAHDAYMFYTNLSQARSGANLLRVALDTEITRDAQFLEGREWHEGGSSFGGGEHQTQHSDTTVLGALVNLFGHKRKIG